MLHFSKECDLLVKLVQAGILCNDTFEDLNGHSIVRFELDFQCFIL